MSGPSRDALEALAVALGTRLGSTVFVDAAGTLAVGVANPLRMCVDARAGGVLALAPMHDAAGDLVSVLTGPVRAPDDALGLLEDLVSHYDACATADLPHHAAALDVAAALASHLSAERGVPVAVSVARRPNVGFDVDEVRVPDEPGMPVLLVAEHGAWVSADGRDGPARDHGSVSLLVEDFAAEAPYGPTPSP